MGAYQDPCCTFGWWWIMPLIMIAFCLCMMFMLRKRMSGMTGPPGFGPKSQGGPIAIAPTDSAKDILDKRCALGEISKDEYEERKRALAAADKVA
jgi:uncharacterized membrane protein